jgi:head-tail adaptor
MRAGKLRHRIALQAPTTAAPTDAGDTAVTFETRAHVWASIDPISAGTRERLSDGRILAEATHEVRLRHYAALAADWQIVFGTRVLRILGPPIRFSERPIEMLVIAAEEKPASG